MTTASEALDRVFEDDRLFPAFKKFREENKQLKSEVSALKDQLFEAQQALLKEGMRADALQAWIDGGIRVKAVDDEGVAYICRNYGPKFPEYHNATLILDEGAQL